MGCGAGREAAVGEKTCGHAAQTPGSPGSPRAGGPTATATALEHSGVGGEGYHAGPVPPAAPAAGPAASCLKWGAAGTNGAPSCAGGFIPVMIGTRSQRSSASLSDAGAGSWRGGSPVGPALHPAPPTIQAALQQYAAGPDLMITAGQAACNPGAGGEAQWLAVAGGPPVVPHRGHAAVVTLPPAEAREGGRLPRSKSAPVVKHRSQAVAMLPYADVVGVAGLTNSQQSGAVGGGNYGISSTSSGQLVHPPTLAGGCGSGSMLSHSGAGGATLGGGGGDVATPPDAPHSVPALVKNEHGSSGYNLVCQPAPTDSVGYVSLKVGSFGSFGRIIESVQDPPLNTDYKSLNLGRLEVSPKSNLDLHVGSPSTTLITRSPFHVTTPLSASFSAGGVSGGGGGGPGGGGVGARSASRTASEFIAARTGSVVSIGIARRYSVVSSSSVASSAMSSVAPSRHARGALMKPDEVNAAIDVEDLVEEAMCTLAPVLDLSALELRALPDSLCLVCDTIESLMFSNNSVPGLPDFIGEFTKLTVLKANNNQIAELPPQIGLLEELRELDLSYNRLRALPDTVRGLTKLKLLVLDWNDFHEFPASVLELISIDNQPMIVNAYRAVLANTHPDLFSWNKIFPDMVLPHLYLGSLRSAQTPMVYQELGIRFVVTCGRNMQINSEGVERLELAVEDVEEQSLVPYFEQFLEFMGRTKGRGNVLVHCFAGLSRSVTMVLCYLVKEAGMRLDDAMVHVLGVRPNVHPNKTFMRELISYDRAVHGEGARALDMEHLGEKRTELRLKMMRGK